MFEGKKILITGGTGSLGQALTKRLLKSDVDIIQFLVETRVNKLKWHQKFQINVLDFF